MKTLFLVFLGGGLGSSLRYLIYLLFSKPFFNIPSGTFIVNITGSLLLGFIMGLAAKNESLSGNTLLFLATGFCGGFTTFSTFAFENQAFLKSGDYFSFALYTAGSIIFGIAAILLGLFVAKML